MSGGKGRVPSLTQNDDAVISQLYLRGESARTIGARYGKSEMSIRCSLRRTGTEFRRPARQRVYDVVDDFFSVIDTDEKAYWLGFIAADGCVFNRGQCFQLAVSLQRRDEPHLFKLRSVLAPDSPIHDRISKNQGFAKDSPQSVLRVTSKAMFHDLVRQGIGPRKSLIMKRWMGPATLQPAYYRGLLDGDGTWFHQPAVKRRAHCLLALIGSEASVIGFRDFVWERTGGQPSALYAHHTTPGVLQISYGRLSIIQEVARLLYDGASVWLDRKRPAVDRLLQMPLTKQNRPAAG